MIKEATPLAKKKHGIKAGVYTPTFEEVIEFSDSLRAFFRKYPDVKDHCEALQGSYRSCSRHAGGVVVGDGVVVVVVVGDGDGIYASGTNPEEGRDNKSRWIMFNDENKQITDEAKSELDF